MGTLGRICSGFSQHSQDTEERLKRCLNDLMHSFIHLFHLKILFELIFFFLGGGVRSRRLNLQFSSLGSQSYFLLCTQMDIRCLGCKTLRVPPVEGSGVCPEKGGPYGISGCRTPARLFPAPAQRGADSPPHPNKQQAALDRCPVVCGPCREKASWATESPPRNPGHIPER